MTDRRWTLAKAILISAALTTGCQPSEPSVDTADIESDAPSVGQDSVTPSPATAHLPLQFLEECVTTVATGYTNYSAHDVELLGRRRRVDADSPVTVDAHPFARQHLRPVRLGVEHQCRAVQVLLRRDVADMRVGVVPWHDTA